MNKIKKFIEFETRNFYKLIGTDFLIDITKIDLRKKEIYFSNVFKDYTYNFVTKNVSVKEIFRRELNGEN